MSIARIRRLEAHAVRYRAAEFNAEEIAHLPVRGGFLARASGEYFVEIARQILASAWIATEKKDG
jgi:hypothetical protein